MERNIKAVITSIVRSTCIVGAEIVLASIFLSDGLHDISCRSKVRLGLLGAPTRSYNFLDWRSENSNLVVKASKLHVLCRMFTKT